MRFNTVICFPWIAFLILSVLPSSYTRDIWRREDTTSNNQPTLISTDGSTPTSASTRPTSTDVSASASTVSTSESATQHTVTTASSRIPSSSATPTYPTSSSSPLPLSSSATSAASATATTSHNQANSLPLKPRITPALGIGGIVLILTGVTYALIGVKNQWVHTFLSAAYLASLSVTVLIIYVMSPPISDAVQGGYLVGIVMTGLIFGAGALIFKEVTEGLGCLLGGFCLSMWLLTLTSGGLITNPTGKGIFVGGFCAVFWSLSFSHYTRVYGLIASTAFSGLTAIVLGIDCFSRAGLKEFWVFTWGLNDNIFPLGTSTYPITRGTRVESIVILLGTIIGVMSQIRLWKIVRDKQHKREEAKMEDQKRKEAVEQALGRHIERHNDKDRAVWERQYGDNPQAKRNTVLWTDTHSEKGYAHLSSSETPISSNSIPSESVEMTPVAAKRLSAYSSKAKRLSSVAEDVIPEEQEDGHEETSKSVYSPIPPQGPSEKCSSSDSLQDAKKSPEIIPHPFQPPAGRDGGKPDALSSKRTEYRSAIEETERASKRLSIQSMLSLSSRLGVTSESQETLVRPTSIHSRPSSIVATLDEDEDTALEPNPAIPERVGSEAPQIVVTPVASVEDLKSQRQNSGGISAGVRQVSPSPPPLLAGLDDIDDPEELTRVPRKAPQVPLPSPNDEREPSQEPKLSSEGRPRQHSDALSQSLNLTTKTSSTDALTPDALNHVPSRVSNVVTSYRTNEWAKHIATADAPVFDEPETIKAIDAEPPTQLGLPSPTLSTTPSKLTVDQLSPAKPDSLSPLVTSTTADGAVIINAKQTEVSPSGKQETEEAVADGVLSPTTSSQIVAQREAVLDAINASNHATTVSSNRAAPSKPKWIPPNTTSRQNFATPPIVEGVPARFPPASRLFRQSSAGNLNRVPSSSSLASYGIAGGRIPGTSHGRQTVTRSYSSTNLNDQKRLSGGPYGMMGYMPAALRSETRLASYDSRQPQQQSMGGDAGRRQGLLAEWRISQQQDVVVGGMPLQQVDTRRAQMLLDKENKKAVEEQQRKAQQQQQFAIDQLSRRPDMQEAHREAMRKMQAKTKV
ncbi:hypothetical protein DV736_g2544, partial [Chaetothyriales sp. CBS 134916]